MKVTLLGHASVLVEMEGVRCLMDPVFADPFEEGAVESCPRRVVHSDKLPPIDVLIISHSHLDHFDIPSLARIPRNCDVLCPKDRAITYVLQQLGFTKIRECDPMTHLVFPRYELMTTHSNVSNVVEFGVLFKDKSGSFWNQVDTVLAPQTIQSTRQKCPKIDLLFAMYASQNFGFFESKGADFPFKMHAMNLNSVVAIEPRVVVPGSAGFRFSGPVDWCNRFLFPVTRERFVADLASLAPNIQSCIANPGDVFDLNKGMVRHLPGASQVASLIEDDTARLRFDPTAQVPPLSDPNPDSYPATRLMQAVDECLQGFADFLDRAYRSGDPIVEEYRRLNASYAIGIVFPDGREEGLRVQFDQQAPQLERGVTLGPADSVHRIAASALTAWTAREKSYFYLRAFSRKYSALCAISRADGKVAIEPKEVRDLLEYYLQRKAPDADMALKQRLDFQLKPHLHPESGPGPTVPASRDDQSHAYRS